jgi:membrane protease YdiL (CAAX protease family)
VNKKILINNSLLFFFGFLISIGIILLGFTVLIYLGIIKVIPNATTFNNQLYNIITCFSGVFLEELIFRYWLFNSLKTKSKSFLWAAIISSAIFSLLRQIGTNSFYPVSLISDFWGSIIYCYAFDATRNIAFPIGLHYGWQYVKVFFTLPTSSEFRTGVVKTILPNNELLLLGGNYGIENGLISLCFRSVILIILVLFVKYGIKSKNNLAEV